MKESLKHFYIALILTMTFNLIGYAQDSIKKAPLRAINLTFEVSGIVTDSLNTPLQGVSIKLVSARDSLQSTTDGNGIFVFKAIDRPEFVLTLKAVGYYKAIRKYLYTDKRSKIVLDPIILLNSVTVLKEVTINGAPPH